MTESFSFPDNPSASATSNALADDTGFAAALLDDLRTAIQQTGLRERGTVAVIEFSLRADGALVGVTIARSSGSAEFDAAVLTACRTTRARNFPVHTIGRKFQIDFRALE